MARKRTALPSEAVLRAMNALMDMRDDQPTRDTAEGLRMLELSPIMRAARFANIADRYREALEKIARQCSCRGAQIARDALKEDTNDG